MFTYTAYSVLTVSHCCIQGLMTRRQGKDKELSLKDKDLRSKDKDKDKDL